MEFSYMYPTITGSETKVNRVKVFITKIMYCHFMETEDLFYNFLFLNLPYYP